MSGLVCLCPPAVIYNVEFFRGLNPCFCHFIHLAFQVCSFLCIIPVQLYFLTWAPGLQHALWHNNLLFQHWWMSGLQLIVFHGPVSRPVWAEGLITKPFCSCRPHIQLRCKIWTVGSYVEPNSYFPQHGLSFLHVGPLSIKELMWDWAAWCVFCSDLIHRY